jgi:hypothetical protein
MAESLLHSAKSDHILAVEICSFTVMGAGAVATEDIHEPGVYVGNR